jgi:hypothetical protein
MRVFFIEAAETRLHCSLPTRLAVPFTAELVRPSKES